MKIIKRTLLALLILIVGAWLVALLKLNFIADKHTPVSEAMLIEAKEYLGDQITPAPANFQWSMFKTEAGVSLRTGLLEHENAKATVVVVPGFTGTIEMIMREITMIHAAGYRVATVEYRGQGLSYRPLPDHPERGYVESYQVLGSEVGQYASSIELANKPLFFFSISKGAHITMRMAAEQGLDVAAYALIVPMIQINSGEVPYETLRSVAKWATKLGLGTAYSPGAGVWPVDDFKFGAPDLCNSNPKTAQAQSGLFASNEKLRTRGVTYKWLYETTKSTDKLFSSDFIAPITAPVKIYTAGIDTIVRTEAAERFCNSLADCETQNYPQARHCITREDYSLYDGIVADAIEHFDTHLN